MNRREKILAIVTGLFVVGFVVYLTADQLILSPSGKLDAEARKLSAEIKGLQRKNLKEGLYVKRLEKLSGRSFGASELQVGNELVKRIKLLLARSGFSDEDQSLSPVSGASVSGVYKEIGRSGRVAGELKHVIDFLYLAKSDPVLHRLDNLIITPKEGGRADMSFRYATLALSRQKGDKQPTTTAPGPQPDVDLNGSERARYSVIAARDLFRPYIKRPPAPIVPAAPPTVARRTPPRTERPAPRPPSAQRFRVVDLSSWGGQDEARVIDSVTGNTRAYKMGEPLADGKAVMIEYKSVPRLDNPLLSSPSRVIIQIGPEYWAIELGQPLTAKRRLKSVELPEQLRAQPPAAKSPQPPDEKPKAQT